MSNSRNFYSKYHWWKNEKSNNLRLVKNEKNEKFIY